MLLKFPLTFLKEILAWKKILMLFNISENKYFTYLYPIEGTFGKELYKLQNITHPEILRIQS